MNVSSLASFAFAVSSVLSIATANAQNWQTTAPGVEYAAFSSGGSAVFAARINLCAPGVRLRATKPGEGPRTVSSFGELSGAALAINGDWWSNDGEAHLPSEYPRGLGIGDGVHFAGTVDRTSYGVVAFGPAIAMHSIMEDDLGGPHWWMQDAVSGQPTLVWDGQLRNNPAAHCGIRRARTATGFSQDMTTMYLGVVQEVDGSAGMTCNEMAAFMKQLGAHSALNQDGGGSSTMWRKGVGVVNKPTDGQQRSLVNHWGVIASGWGPPRSCVARDIVAPEHGVRRHVTSPAIMEAWSFAFADVTFMGLDTLVQYAEGPSLAEGPRFVRDDAGDAWLIDQGVKRKLPSATARAGWRVRADDLPLSATELATLIAGPPLRELPILMLGAEGAVFLLDDKVTPGAGPDGPDGSGSGSGTGTDSLPDDAGGCAVASGPTGYSTLLLVLFVVVIRRPKRGR